MKLVDDFRSERLITLELTERELGILFLALDFADTGELNSSARIRNIPIVNTAEDEECELLDSLEKVLNG